MKSTAPLRDLWATLSPAQRRWALGAQSVSLVMAFSTVAGIAAITPFFAVLGDSSLIHRNRWLSALYAWGGFQTEHAFVVGLGTAFIATAILSNLVNLLGAYVLQRVAFTIGNDMKSLLFREYLRRNLLFHARTNSSILLNNIVFEAVRGPIGMLQSLFQVVTGLVTSMAIVVSILIVNPFVAAAVVAILIGGYCGVYLANRQNLQHSARPERTLVGEQMKLIAEALGAIRHVLLLNRQEYFQKRFDATCHKLSRLAAFNDLATNSPRQIIECVAVATLVAACLVLIDSEGGAGHWLAQLTFLGFAVYRLLPALQQTFTSVVRLRGASTGFAIIAPDLLAARGQAPVRRAAETAKRLAAPSIELQNISLSYDQHGVPALDDISLRIPAGAVVGIIGANGSGKTSLVDVIAGFLEPDRGRVLIDDTELAHLDIASWRSSIAYVPQSTFLFDASIAENIALGVDLEDIDPQRLRRAARLARMDDLIAQLPLGFEQKIGERGVRLSGGQAQRIGIARALYRDCSLLIMDEATSSADVEGESQIVESVESIRGEATILLIAHHHSTLKNCDFIVELNCGRLVSENPLAKVALAKEAGPIAV
jgi:ABC-type multidrug transport system fused ATPase/permease subunit